MPRLLHIQASPRGLASISNQVADAFLATHHKNHGLDGAETLNVFSSPIPEFHAPQAAAKYTVLSGAEPQDAEAMAWQPVVEAIEHFKSFDEYMISSPMWNFSIPYRLKQYVDVLVQPGLTFKWSPATGYQGLVTGRPAMLVLARGGEYPEPGMDFQKPYLEMILKFIGFTAIRSIVVDCTLTPQGERNTISAVEEARKLGAVWPR